MTKIFSNLMLVCACITATLSLFTREIIVCKKEEIVCKSLTGADTQPYIAGMARVHTALFSKFPYLMNYTQQEIERHLKSFFKLPCATALVLCEGNEVVGLSRGIRFDQDEPELHKPFLDRNLQLKDYWYIAEVLIEPEYRNQGWLRIFFKTHEHYAKAHGCSYLLIDTVKRCLYHPLRPKRYRLLEPVWRHFGFEKMNGMDITYSWNQIDSEGPVESELELWFKKLSA